MGKEGDKDFQGFDAVLSLLSYMTKAPLWSTRWPPKEQQWKTSSVRAWASHLNHTWGWSTGCELSQYTVDSAPTEAIFITISSDCTVFVRGCQCQSALLWCDVHTRRLSPRAQHAVLEWA